MTSKDNIQDEELLDRYRQASDTDAVAPSEGVRAAILAESRRVAEQRAKQAPPHPFDVSRPAANDSRWKIAAFGTVGAALLAALLFAPRYWESRPTTRVGDTPAAKTESSDAAAPAPASAPATAPAPTTAAPTAAAPPKLESIAPSSAAESLQEVVVTQADLKASKKSAELSRQYAAPAPGNPPSVAQKYAPAQPAQSPVANSLAPLPAASSDAPPAYTARAAESGALSTSAARAARARSVPTPSNLQSAAGLGDVAQAASLLDQGAAIDARDEAGRTPLMLAVLQGRLEVVRLLLARGADPNAADNAGHTPLQQATKSNLQDVAELLEKAGAH